MKQPNHIVTVNKMSVNIAVCANILTSLAHDTSVLPRISCGMTAPQDPSAHGQQ